MKKLHAIHPNGEDAKFVGQEPTWQTVTDKEYVKEMIRGLNWHHYVGKETNFRKYLIEWTSVFAKNHQDMISSLSDSDLDHTLAIIARMQLQGFPLREHHVQAIHDYLNAKANKQKKTRTKRTEDDTPKHVPDVQAAMKAKVSPLLAEIDALTDNALDTEEVDSQAINDQILGKIQEQNLKAPHVRFITQHIEKYLNEWAEAYKGEDEQLSAAYKFIPKRKFKKIIDCFTSAQELIGKYIEKTKVIRKKKPVSKATIVKGIHPVQEAFGITGLPATSLVGATVVWLFDTKYRKIIRITGEKKSISASGMTLTNVKTSESKVLRKPETQLKSFNVTRGKTSHEWFDALSSKSGDGGFRVNRSMLILKTE